MKLPNCVRSEKSEGASGPPPGTGFNSQHGRYSGDHRRLSPHYQGYDRSGREGPSVPGPSICLQYVDENTMLHVLTVQPELIQKIVDSRVDTVNGPIAALEPVVQRTWIRSVSHAVSSAQQAGYVPVILCPEEARILVKNSTEREIPDLVVLSVPKSQMISGLKLSVKSGRKNRKTGTYGYIE